MILKKLGQRALRALGYTMLRRTSEGRAYTDLFVEPYCSRVEWQSGLGDCIYILYGWVMASRPEVIVEIGSSRGKSTCALALACRQRGFGKVFAIDPHTPNAWTDKVDPDDTFRFLSARLRAYHLDPWCQIIRSTSEQACEKWSLPVDFLFVDGDHSYEGVNKDFTLFKPWLKTTSVVAFHDSLWEYHKNNPDYRADLGVARFLEELRSEGYPTVTVQAFPGLTFVSPSLGGLALVPSSSTTGDRCPTSSPWC